MSKCINIELSDGKKVSVLVGANTESIPEEDIDALEDWIKSVRARHLKSIKTEAES